MDWALMTDHRRAFEATHAPLFDPLLAQGTNRARTGCGQQRTAGGHDCVAALTTSCDRHRSAGVQEDALFSPTAWLQTVLSSDAFRVVDCAVRDRRE